MLKTSTALPLLFTIAACAGESPANPATTPGHAALTNLSAQITGVEGAYRRNGSTGLGAHLVGLRLSRSQFTGSYDDLGIARAFAEEMLAKHGERPNLLITHASVLSSQHDFEGAKRDLLRAEELGADVTRERATIDLATGEGYDELLDSRHRAHDAAPTFSNTTALAAIQAAWGNFTVADSLYQAAANDYRDVSPLPLAWIAFQRGVMWGEQADRPDLARPLYETAVQLLPDYVVANVHLAELEASDGDVNQAIARLERIAGTTQDPEPLGLLSELLADSDPTRAAALGREATRAYDTLLANYPLAFLDHGSELFAGPGPAHDATRALELAMTNLEHRRNARAFIVAIAAAQTHGNDSLTCSLARDAVHAEGKNINLANLLASMDCP